MSDFLSLPPAERFALILEGLFQSITRRGMPGFRVVPIPGPLLTLIWNRLARLRTRFLRALATPYAPRRRNPAPDTVIARSAATRQSRLCPQPSSSPPPYTLPRHKAWLRRLIPECGSGATQLCHFLNQPDAMALIAADPRLGRILRPLCHALHIRPSQVPCLYPPPNTPPPAAPPPAAPIAVSPQITPPPLSSGVAPPPSPCRPSARPQPSPILA